MISTLVALFVRRMLAPEADDTAGAASRLAAFGAVAMGPGVLVAATAWVRAIMYVFLGEPNPEAYAAAVAGDRQLLVALALGASGLATASLLDTLFPDERDHACLGPLPLPSRLVLGSRLAALLVPALLVAAAASLPPGFLHALAVTTGGAPEGFLRHAAALVSSLAAASLTAFLAVAGTGGLLLLLPRGVARTLAAPIQAFLVVGSVLQPLPAFARRAAVPFVGLHATLLGRATPVDLDAARGAGLVASLAAAALLAGFAASARRYATGDFGPVAAARRGTLSRPASAMLARAGRSGPERHALRLILPTLARSGRHRRTVLTLAAGGAALAFPGLASARATAGPLPLHPALTALFLVSFALLVALRAAFGMPLAARPFETLRAMGATSCARPLSRREPSWRRAWRRSASSRASGQGSRGVRPSASASPARTRSSGRASRGSSAAPSAARRSRPGRCPRATRPRGSGRGSFSPGSTAERCPRSWPGARRSSRLSCCRPGSPRC